MEETGTELIKNLKQISKNAEDLAGRHIINLDTIFTETFMSKYTNFNDFFAFLENGGFKATNQEEFDNINDDELDKYISLNTKFDSFEDMLTEAVKPFIGDMLFENL